MLAFGGFGSFGRVDDATPVAAAAPAVKPPPPQRQPPSALETGTLDMSAFGVFGGFGAEPAPPPPPPPLAAQMVRSQQGALDTGMLNMSAFAGFGAEPPPPPRPSPPKSALESGTLDFSAFSGFGGFAVDPPPPSPPLQPPPQPSPSRHASALDSGMLDMSAFGGFGGFGQEPPPPPPPPPPLPPAPPPPPPPPQPRAADPLHSGMLDMSAFGGFGIGQYSQQDDGDAYDNRAAAAASRAPVPVIISEATPPAPSTLTSAAAAAPPPLDTGMLDMSSFGGFDMGWTAPPPPPPPPLPPATAAESPPRQLGPPLPAASAFEHRPSLPPRSALDSWTSSSSGPADSVPAPAASSSQPGVATTATRSAGASGNVNDPWVTFPRVPEPATAADPELPELLLAADEVAELHRLLGQDPPSSQNDPSPKPALTAVLDSAAAAAPRKRRGSDGADDAVEDAVASLRALGLTPEDGLELCRLAVALSRKTVEQLGGGGVVGGGGATDVTAGLDFAARAFLVQARLAAVGAHAAAAAAAATGGQDDGAFAAAVSRLFRPVSVSRSSAAPPASNPVSSAPSSATLASPGTIGAPSAFSATATRLDPAANPSDPTSYSLGKPTSRKGLRTSGAGTRGSRGASGGTSGPASRRSRSVRSVLSVFSFASLPGSLYGDGSGSTNVAGDVGAVHHNDGDGGSSSSSWWRLCGLMEGLDMRSCLMAVASGSQAQLLEAVLPSVPWVASVDEEASAAPDGRHAGGMMGSGAGSGSSSAAASQPRPALSWPLLRKVGAGFWLADPRVVREQAEALAKAQYARRKEPYDCALLYLALGRKALLLSLFRQASNLKIAEFLLKDFSQPEPRRSAAKNAFALLGQHRYELAAAFFILAAQPQEAVSVLVRERRDPQLALLVARLLDAPAAGGNGGGGGGIMSVSSSGSSSLGLGGPLARRLIEKELLPLALASRDPCAVACLDLLAGQPLRAVMRLLCCGGGGGAVPGAGGSSGRSSNDGSSCMGMAGSMGDDAAAAGGLEGPGLALDATALDYCLQVGVQHLSGKPVPRSACRSLRRLALRTSRVLEQAGLASAALEALLVAAALAPPAGPQAATRAGPLPPAMARRYSRLLAACLSFSLGEVASPTEREPQHQQPQQHDCMSQGEGGAGWQRRALQALAALGPMLSHSSVDQTAVLRLLGRHVNASKRVRQQPLVPPELLMTRPPPPASAAAAAHTSHHQHQQQQQQQQQQHPGHAQQLPRQQGSAGGTPLPALPAHQHPHALLRGTGPGPVGLHGPDSGQQQGPTYPGMGPGHQSAFAAVGSAGGTAEQGAAAATAAHLARLRVSRSNSGGGAGGGGAGSGYSSGRLSPQSSTGSLFGGAAAGSGGTAAAAGVPGGLGVSPEGSACSTPGGPMGHQQHRQSSGSFSGPQGRPPVPPPAYMAAGAGGYPHQQGPMGRHQPPAAPSSPKSSAHGGEGARRGEGVASGGGGGGPSGWGAFEAPWDVLAVEGDRCRAVAVLRGRGRGVGEEGQLPFAVATAKSGLLGGLLGPPALAPPPKSAAAGPSSLFLGLMQSVLHHVRWTPDPWAMMSGDFGVDMAVAPGGTAAGGGGTGGAASAGGGGGGGGGGHRGGHPGPPTHAASSAGGGGSAGGPGVTGGTSTVTLAAHPETDVYLSGSSSLLVYQWRFGEPHAHTAYVPCLEPYAGGGPGAAAAAAAARSRAAATGGGGGPASAAASVASALDLHAPHWGHAAALSYSTPSGGRFAGIGEGGLVALWRADAMGPGGLGYADWTHQCVSRHGRAVSFVGDSSSQVLVAGQGERGGLVGWWDSLAPSSAACVAEIRGRKALPTALALLRPDAGGVLVFGDEAGDLVATDLRMMSAREYIWTIPRAHSGPVTAMAQWGHTAAGVLNLPPVLPAGAGTSSAASSHPYQPPVPHQPPVQLQQARMSNLLVSGGKDGSLALVDISSGRVVASLDRAHNSTRTGLPGLLAAAAASTGGAHRAVDRSIVRRSRPATAAGVAVSGLCCMRDAGGVLSCGADGAVRYHPFAPQLLDLRR
ncbi:hypothetical protein Agub_g2427 [Astrephomene gubernaculifera]|uniref:RAVE complex protein Rav1 C-terminal domain-containing protein n=1 Tax=Astrephomene gubernaculifera TaxID=47775 RepID=A0AAD3DH14_9CHLO|nr:hypothetical protein Agub_g2427 [Astrephomene gubernaculifera]